MRKGSVDLKQILSRLALLGLIGGLAGACSSDTTRLASNPFSNPFGSGAKKSPEPTMTASLPEPAVPRTTVQAQPLPTPQAAPRPVAGAPADIRPAPVAQAPATRPTQTGPGGWTAQGGTPITVAAGDSLNTIANRYGIPGQAILSTNGLANAAQVTPGRRVVIPVYNAAGMTPTVAAKRQAEPPKAIAQKPDAKDRARQAGAKPEPHPAAKLAARSNDIKQAAKKPEPKAIEAKAVASVKAEPIKPAKLEKVAAAPAPAVRAEPVRPIEAAKAPKEIESTASIPAQPKASLGFRWPAKGRVINGFGSAGNEGINIALPEGTPVKAAEDGTVAYAGSEVKGYGKLVLIRHDNGHVSAYAHNGDIAVKHGEKVKRGQTIAKSGQSGNVTSPQLHFEIRKGATPIDPMPHLTGG
jgi:murein DD-endopeptidase MepM/ murein hydrolase activator NlpD